MAHDTSRFSNSKLFEYHFSTNEGEVGFLAEVLVFGTILILNDIAVYPDETVGTVKLGTAQVLKALHLLKDMARAEGFLHMRITGLRLSGANPGRAVNIEMEL